MTNNDFQQLLKEHAKPADYPLIENDKVIYTNQPNAQAKNDQWHPTYASMDKDTRATSAWILSVLQNNRKNVE